MRRLFWGLFLFVFFSLFTACNFGFPVNLASDIDNGLKTKVQLWVDSANVHPILTTPTPYFWVKKVSYFSSEAEFSPHSKTAVYIRDDVMNVCFSSGGYYYVIYRNRSSKNTTLDVYEKGEIIESEVLQPFYLK